MGITGLVGKINHLKTLLPTSVRTRLGLEYNKPVHPPTVPTTTSLPSTNPLESLGAVGIGTTYTPPTTREDFLDRVSNGILSGCETIALGLHGLQSDSGSAKTGFVLAFGGGVLAAAAITTTLWYIGIPLVSLGISKLALTSITATAASLIATKYNNRFPVHGTSSYIGSAARFVSRTVAPFIYAGDGIYAGAKLHQANLDITNLLNSPEVCWGIMLATVAFAARQIRNSLKAHDAAYVGKNMPGQKANERSMLTGALVANFGEYNYGVVRLILTGVVTANIFSNLAGFGVIPLLLPLVGIGVTMGLRARHDVTFESREHAERLDHFKTYTPLWGLATGGVAAGIHGLLSGSLMPPIAFFTLYGTMAVLFLTDFFNIFHTTNTNNELLVKMQSSRTDWIGQTAMKQATRGDNCRLVMHNPVTGGVADHARGLSESLLLNRKPGGLTYVCSSDLIHEEDPNNMADYAANEDFLAWAKSMQAGMFDRLQIGLTPQTARALTVRQRYEQLRCNLEAIATYAEGPLFRSVIDQFRARPDWSEVYEDIVEYQRGAMQQFGLLAEEFREDAQRLQRKLDHGYLDNADFEREATDLFSRYDPEAISLFLFSRKSVVGDGLEVAKLPNVAAILLWRGVTVYILEQQERAAALDTVKDVIGAEWSQFKNPNYSYFAEPGTPRAAKYIYIPSHYLLTELQERQADSLSTSAIIGGVNNRPNPAVDPGFVKSETPITLRINDHQVTIPANECFYVTNNNPFLAPTVKNIVPRAGVTPAQVDAMFTDPDPLKRYNLSHYRERPQNTGDRTRVYMDPSVWTLTSFDFIMMCDRNDVEFVGNMLLPTIIKRERRDVFVQLMFMQPVGSGIAGYIRRQITGGEFQFDDPHSDRDIDERYGLQVYDGTVEISDPKTGLLIPYLVARNTLHKGIDAGFDKPDDWKSLQSAKVTIGPDKKPIAFSFIYGKKTIKVAGKDQRVKGPHELVMPPSRWPSFLNSLELAPREHELAINNFSITPDRKGAAAWIRICYQPDAEHPEGSIGFARCADGKRPFLFNKPLARYKSRGLTTKYPHTPRGGA